MNPFQRTLWAVLVLWVTLACPGAPHAARAAAYDVVAPPSLYPGDPVPIPRGRVVLRVYGATGTPNADGHFAFDLPTLRRLGLVRYGAPNRWTDGPARVTGVLLSRLLALVGVPRGADMLRLRALNDYVARVPLADVERWPLLLALEMNGSRLTVRDKGPVWLVYPSQSEPELASPSHQGKWVWQLSEIHFE